MGVTMPNCETLKQLGYECVKFNHQVKFFKYGRIFVKKNSYPPKFKTWIKQQKLGDDIFLINHNECWAKPEVACLIKLTWM